MRGNDADRLAVIEVIAEFRASLFLASRHFGHQLSIVLQMLTQLAQELRIFGELLHQDLSCAIQRRLGVWRARILAILGRERGFQILRRFGLRVETGIRQQRLGQPIEARLASNHCLGAPLGLVGEVQVLQALLGVGARNGSLQLVGEFALLLDALENGGAPLFELAQIAQTLLEGT